MTLYCNGQPYIYEMHDEWFVDNPHSHWDTILADLSSVSDAVWEGDE